MFRFVKAVLACALAAPLATLACKGVVTIGEGADQVVTPVPNKSIKGSCLNDLIVDTVAEGAEYDSHAEFVARLILQTLQWRKTRSIGAQSPAAQPIAIDELYERALAATLQVIAAR